MVSHAAPGGDVRAGGGVVRGDAHDLAHSDVDDVSRQPDDRQRAPLSAVVEGEVSIGRGIAGWLRRALGQPVCWRVDQWKESPQAQEPVAFGFSIVKPWRSIVSTKSMVAPPR